MTAIAQALRGFRASGGAFLAIADRNHGWCAALAVRGCYP